MFRVGEEDDEQQDSWAGDGWGTRLDDQSPRLSEDWWRGLGGRHPARGGELRQWRRPRQWRRLWRERQQQPGSRRRRGARDPQRLRHRWRLVVHCIRHLRHPGGAPLLNPDLYYTPQLADEMPEVLSEKPLVIQYRLKDRVAWSDGKPLTSADAKWTFQQIMDPKNKIFRLNAVTISILLVALSWTTIARVVRGQVLSLRNREFVMAAQAIGVSKAMIMARHILPNVVGVMVVQTTLAVGLTILAESALSFLGLGIQPPTPSWGNLLSDAQSTMTQQWWLAVFPGAMIILTVLCVNFLGDGLRDALDSKAVE